MRAAVYYGRQDVRIEDVPEPEVGPDEVKIRVAYNGLCGSDVHEFFDGPFATRIDPHPLTGVCNPVILGHELSGTIESVGSAVADLRPGDRVAVEPLETCGVCLPCKDGQYNHCGLVAFHGYNRRGGGLAEFTTVKRSMAHLLPSAVSDRMGALIEPMTVAYHTANRCLVEAGQTVVVHGAGPIGVGVYLNLRRRGVRVIVSDTSSFRRAILKRLGAEIVLDPAEHDVVSAIKDLTDGRGAHASVDAAGVAPAFSAALHSTRVDGQVVVVAIHGAPLVIPPTDILMPEVRITGVAMFCNEFPQVIAEMAAGAYPMDGWIETISMDRLIDDGFRRLQDQRAMKILVAVGNS